MILIITNNVSEHYEAHLQRGNGEAASASGRGNSRAVCSERSSVWCYGVVLVLYTSICACGLHDECNQCLCNIAQHSPTVIHSNSGGVANCYTTLSLVSQPTRFFQVRWVPCQYNSILVAAIPTLDTSSTWLQCSSTSTQSPRAILWKWSRK